MDQTLTIGTQVRTTDGFVGEVVDLERDPGSDIVVRATVRTDGGGEQTFPIADLTPIGDAAVGWAGGGADVEVLAAGEDHLLIPVHVEELEAVKRSVESGTVRIERRVETVPQEVTIDLQREEVAVERVPVGRPVDAAPEPRWEGETLVVPVVEEEIVVTKRLMLREEVRVTRRVVSEPVTRTETIRRETVRIDGADERAIASE